MSARSAHADPSKTFAATPIDWRDSLEVENPRGNVGTSELPDSTEANDGCDSSWLERESRNDRDDEPSRGREERTRDARDGGADRRARRAHPRRHLPAPRSDPRVRRTERVAGLEVLRPLALLANGNRSRGRERESPRGSGAAGAAARSRGVHRGSTQLQQGPGDLTGGDTGDGGHAPLHRDPWNGGSRGEGGAGSAPGGSGAGDRAGEPSARGAVSIHPARRARQPFHRWEAAARARRSLSRRARCRDGADASGGPEAGCERRTVGTREGGLRSAHLRTAPRGCSRAPGRQRPL